MIPMHVQSKMKERQSLRQVEVYFSRREETVHVVWTKSVTQICDYLLVRLKEKEKKIASPQLGRFKLN